MRHYIIGALVLIAILCADLYVPATVVCVGLAVALSYGKTPDTV